ncbi:o-succinylbenzoate synthase [Psychromonas sp. L1A2]|uniref:o-succinylbenzoate synthase n=1 Tax=Psychromonas sp. L1A2 TaxID=2686356 RepID=UPI0013587803|nr:o-succinylbenzoate synthase [Psychromonas sp. L1A2]
MSKLNKIFHLANMQLSLYRFSLPFKHPLNFKGHHLTAREGLWLVSHQADGQCLIGEVCPLPGFSNETLEQCQQYLLGALQTASNLQEINIHHFPLLSSVHFALFCLQQQIPWHKAENSDLVNLTSVPLLQGDHAEILLRYQQLTCPALIKLKVGRFTVKEEVNLLKKLIQLNPKIRFRLDANQQWTEQQYAQFLTLIDSKYIDYIEEPTASLVSNINISKQFNVSIALDESLLNNVSIPTHDCVKALIIKPTLIGCPDRIEQLLQHAQQQQLSVSVSASFESPVAINQLQHLAIKWQQQYNVKVSLGLDTLHAFADKPSDIITQLESLLIHPHLNSSIQVTCLWKSQ